MSRFNRITLGLWGFLLTASTLIVLMAPGLVLQPSTKEIFLPVVAGSLVAGLLFGSPVFFTLGFRYLGVKQGLMMVVLGLIGAVVLYWLAPANWSAPLLAPMTIGAQLFCGVVLCQGLTALGIALGWLRPVQARA